MNKASVKYSALRLMKDRKTFTTKNLWIILQLSLTDSKQEFKKIGNSQLTMGIAQNSVLIEIY